MKRVESLEKTLNLAESSLNTLLELAQLYIEPCHRESDAIQLYETILKRDPQNSAAKFWLSYCCIWYLMDKDALKRAVALLENIIATDKNFSGAACILLAEAMGDLYNLPMEEKIKFLEASIQYEPNWVYNHLYLAWAYQAAKRYHDALNQTELALANFKKYGVDFVDDNSIFENEITGRASRYVEEKLKELIIKVEKILSESQK
ncbi:MAG: hypothetical protein AAB592_02475 [Patescibacteria group bacterium]